MGFSGELLGSPTVGNTLETVTLCNGDDIDVFALFEDSGDLNGFLEKPASVVDLVGDGPSVHLDLHEMSLLLAQTYFSNLGVGKNADDSTVFADALKFTVS